MCAAGQFMAVSFFFKASVPLYTLERTIFHPSNCERNWADPVRDGSDKRARELLFVGPLEGLLLETYTADFYVARETRAAGVGLRSRAYYFGRVWENFSSSLQF